MSFVETSSGNRIAKSAQIKGSNRILISGNTTIQTNVQLNGDIPSTSNTSATSTTIQIGKFVYINSNTIITPTKERITKIGSYVMIGSGCFIQSSNIGNRVIIHDNVKLEAATNIQDCVIIKSNTTIPKHSNIPPFSLVHTNDNKLIVETLPESYKKLIENSSKLSYVNNQFIPSEIP